MSDISIPGISNNRGMDTARMVDDLMEVERIPLRRIERDVEQFQLQRETWQSMGRTLSGLRDAARRLYGFENPFRDRLAQSSNTQILTATASRQAPEGMTEISVLQTAGRDRLASNSLPRDTRVAPGNYTFTLGEMTRSFRFGGGTLDEFSEQVNRRVGDVVRTVVVPDTSSTRIIIFEGQGEGSGARLSFGDASEALMERIGVMAPARPERSVALLQDEVIRLEPGQQETLSLDQPFRVDPEMVLRFEARTIESPREPWTPPPTPPGPALPERGTTSFGGVTIRDEVPSLDLPEIPRPEPPPLVEDNRAVTIAGGGDTQLLPEVPRDEEFRTVTVPARDLISQAEQFQFNNRNTDRTLEIRNISIVDPEHRGDSQPANALETARDARILYSGIEITRSSNQVDDLIPGVTLTLRRPSPDPVEIEVSPNREAAKEAIIEFVGYYNQVVRDINIYTRNDRSIVDQIDYFTDAERETMEARLGIFQGDSSLNQLRTRMQTILMNPYPTGDDSGLRLLAQIGVSSNASGLGGGVDTSRMRGYMEINEAQLDRVLEEDFAAVGRLFGQDTDGDLVVDSGAALAMEQFTTSYVQTGGIIASRSNSLNTRIDQAETRIGRINEQLERTEQRLRVEFGRMDGALQQLQEQSRSLDNLQGLGGTGR